MALNLMDIDSYQDTEDASALINIIKLAEKDIENGNVKKADDVFNELYTVITAQTIKKAPNSSLEKNQF